MTISNFVAYVKQAWKNKPDTSTPLSAARLTHLEDGIKGNSDAIEKIAAAVVSQIVNDPNKIASMASLYSVNQAVTQLNSDLDDTNATVALKTNSIDLKYQIRELNGQDVIILPQGRWCANNGTANNELGYWYVEVVEFDSRYRTITVHPYEGSKNYFYYAKMIEGVWQGWEKYNSVL